MSGLSGFWAVFERFIKKKKRSKPRKIWAVYLEKPLKKRSKAHYEARFWAQSFKKIAQTAQILLQIKNSHQIHKNNELQTANVTLKLDA